MCKITLCVKLHTMQNFTLFVKLHTTRDFCRSNKGITVKEDISWNMSGFCASGGRAETLTYSRQIVMMQRREECLKNLSVKYPPLLAIDLKQRMIHQSDQTLQCKGSTTSGLCLQTKITVHHLCSHCPHCLRWLCERSKNTILLHCCLMHCSAQHKILVVELSGKWRGLVLRV